MLHNATLEEHAMACRSFPRLAVLSIVIDRSSSARIIPVEEESE
jgi:hypothetical protein